MIFDKIIEKITKLNIRFERDCSLKNASTFRIGGNCALAVFPSNIHQLVHVLDMLDENGIRTHVLGKGSNTLFSDGWLDMAVIFTSEINAVSIENNCITCGAGGGLIPLASKACEAGLSGLEFASGIPGSVGGAVFMNAGAYGYSMDNVVVCSTAYDREIGRASCRERVCLSV